MVHGKAPPTFKAPIQTTNSGEAETYSQGRKKKKKKKKNKQKKRSPNRQAFFATPQLRKRRPCPGRGKGFPSRPGPKNAVDAFGPSNGQVLRPQNPKWVWVFHWKPKERLGNRNWLIFSEAEDRRMDSRKLGSEVSLPPLSQVTPKQTHNLATCPKL